MGWTHYWQRDTELPPAGFTRAVADCALLLGQLGIPLAGPDGQGNPLFEGDHVAFNGAGPQQGEPFEIRRVEFDRRGRPFVRSFCKTGRLPYGLAVQTALVVFQHHLGSTLKVSSDEKTDAWEKARRLCQDQLGYGVDFRLEVQ